MKSKKVEVDTKQEAVIDSHPVPEIVMLPIDDLHEPPWNCRIHTQRGIDALQKSIREVGYIDPIVVWRDGIIIAGNARWKAVKALGDAMIPTIVRSDLTEEQAKWYSLASNRISEFNGYDEHLRYELAAALEDGTTDLATLFTPEELEERRMWALDFEPEAPIEPSTDLPDEPTDQERAVQRVEVRIEIPAGLWISIAEEVGALVKGLKDRHPEIAYTVKELAQ